MKKVVSLFLVLLLSLGIFVACGDSEALTKETIVGTWEGTVTMQEVLGNQKVDVTIEFTEDEMSLKMDEDSVKSVLEDLYEDEDFLQEFVKMTKEEFEDMLKAANMTLDQMIDTTIQAMESEVEMEYTFDGKELLIDGDEAAFTYKNGVLTIEYEGEEMRLTRK